MPNQKFSKLGDIWWKYGVSKNFGFSPSFSSQIVLGKICPCWANYAQCWAKFTDLLGTLGPLLLGKYEGHCWAKITTFQFRPKNWFNNKTITKFKANMFKMSGSQHSACISVKSCINLFSSWKKIFPLRTSTLSWAKHAHVGQIIPIVGQTLFIVGNIWL